MSEELLALTADIVSAHVGHNSIAASNVPTLIQSVYRALHETARPPVAPERSEPAVPVRSSIKPDYLVCLEDGKQLKMLKRHLSTRFGPTPADYRTKWGLSADYPMVAPNYAASRSALAVTFGFERRRGDPGTSDATSAQPVEAAAEKPVRATRLKLKLAGPKWPESRDAWGASRQPLGTSTVQLSPSTTSRPERSEVFAVVDIVARSRAISTSLGDGVPRNRQKADGSYRARRGGSVSSPHRSPRG